MCSRRLWKSCSEEPEAPEEPEAEDPEEPELLPALPPTTAFTAVTVPETGAASEQDARFLVAVSTAIWADVVLDVAPPPLWAELRAVAAEAICSLSLRAELACWLAAWVSAWLSFASWACAALSAFWAGWLLGWALAAV